MAFLRDQHCDSHLDLPMVKRLALKKASYLALLMVKCLAQYFGLQMESHLYLMKELSWVLQMAPLMVLKNLCLALMKASYLFS